MSWIWRFFRCGSRTQRQIMTHLWNRREIQTKLTELTVKVLLLVESISLVHFSHCLLILPSRFYALPSSFASSFDFSAFSAFFRKSTPLRTLSVQWTNKTRTLLDVHHPLYCTNNSSKKTSSSKNIFSICF